MLRSGFNDDPGLYSLFEGMLTNPLAEWGGVFHVSRKGAMAGTPTSPFLANLYLGGLNLRFHEIGVPYFRYADDLIVFARDEAELEGHIETMHGWFKDMGLEINPRKEYRFMLGEPVDFLGFSVHGRTVDLSVATVRKMKMKIRRSGRSLRSWMVRTGTTADAAMGVMLRKYNNKFFGREGGELSWAYWYFPTITTDASLREIDAHLQSGPGTWRLGDTAGRITKPFLTID